MPKYKIFQKNLFRSELDYELLWTWRMKKKDLRATQREFMTKEFYKATMTQSRKKGWFKNCIK